MNQKSVFGAKKTPSSLVRPQYSPGLLLNDDDLTLAVDYTRSLNRLLFRSLLGSGVVCGFVVKQATTCGKLQVTVDAGMALDCHGDPLHLASPSTITIDPTCGVELPPTLWVLARRYDKQCAPRGSVCSPDDDDAASAYTRLHDGVEISVMGVLPDGACGCTTAAATAAATEAASLPSKETDPCYHDHYAGICNVCCSDDCSCEWLVLARLSNGADAGWKVDHAVRRFIRPALIVDPQVALDNHTDV